MQLMIVFQYNLVNYHQIQQFVYRNFIWKIVFNLFQPLKNSFLKIEDCHFVENLFLEDMIRDLLESHHFFKCSSK